MGKDTAIREVDGQTVRWCSEAACDRKAQQLGHEAVQQSQMHAERQETWQVENGNMLKKCRDADSQGLQDSRLVTSVTDDSKEPEASTLFICLKVWRDGHSIGSPVLA